MSRTRTPQYRDHHKPATTHKVLKADRVQLLLMSEACEVLLCLPSKDIQLNKTSSGMLISGRDYKPTPDDYHVCSAYRTCKSKRTL